MNELTTQLALAISNHFYGSDCHNLMPVSELAEWILSQFKNLEGEVLQQAVMDFSNMATEEVHQHKPLRSFQQCLLAVLEIYDKHTFDWHMGIVLDKINRGLQVSQYNQALITFLTKLPTARKNYYLRKVKKAH